MFEFLKKGIEVKIIAPISGRIRDITEVPDEVFSQKMVGDGIAIEPSDGLVVAPCRGKIVQIFNTNHAVGIRTREGLDILIHLGIDTVELKGEGFTRIAEVDGEIHPGEPLIQMDLKKIRTLGKDTVSPILITNPEVINEITKETGIIVAGKDRIMTIKMKNNY